MGKIELFTYKFINSFLVSFDLNSNSISLKYIAFAIDYDYIANSDNLLTSKSNPLFSSWDINSINSKIYYNTVYGINFGSKIIIEKLFKITYLYSSESYDHIIANDGLKRPFTISYKHVNFLQDINTEDGDSSINSTLSLLSQSSQSSCL